MFHRNADGAIERAGRFPTGGSGADSGTNPLGSQGPLILSADNRTLFAVNAGSNSISTFSVSGDELSLVQSISSGGTRPISLTLSHDLLYVLNSGDSPNINGFRIVPEGRPMVRLEGSTQALPSGAAAEPAEASFNPEGNVLLVTERASVRSIPSRLAKKAGPSLPTPILPPAACLSGSPSAATTSRSPLIPIMQHRDKAGSVRTR